MRGRDYAELRALAAIVEHKSFARAAKQLRITPSALSQTIRGLESRLGVRLLHRTTRSVAPSEDGERLLARVAPALAELDAAVADIGERRDQPAGSVRINTPRGVAMFYLAPLFGRCARANPEIALDIVVDDRITDIVAGGYDAGIRLGERLDKDMIAVKLGGEQQLLAVASPSYIARYGTPRELSQHRCINQRLATDLSLYRWAFERRRKRIDVAVEGPLIVNEPDLALSGALPGVGIAYLFRYVVESALATGKLVPVLESWSPPFAGFYLYHPSRKYLRPPLRTFIDFLRREIK